MSVPVDCPSTESLVIEKPFSDAAETQQELSFGRVLKIRLGSEGETMEIRSSEGAVELKIRLTPTGPVVSLEGATLELTSLKDVSIDCQKFQVNAEKDVQVYTDNRLILLGREAHMRTSDNIFLNAAQIQQQGP